MTRTPHQEHLSDEVGTLNPRCMECATLLRPYQQAISLAFEEHSLQVYNDGTADCICGWAAAHHGDFLYTQHLLDEILKLSA